MYDFVTFPSSVMTAALWSFEQQAAAACGHKQTCGTTSWQHPSACLCCTMLNVMNWCSDIQCKVPHCSRNNAVQSNRVPAFLAGAIMQSTISVSCLLGPLALQTSRLHLPGRNLCHCKCIHLQKSERSSDCCVVLCYGRSYCGVQVRALCSGAPVVHSQHIVADDVPQEDGPDLQVGHIRMFSNHTCQSTSAAFEVVVCGAYGELQCPTQQCMLVVVSCLHGDMEQASSQSKQALSIHAFSLLAAQLADRQCIRANTA